MLRLLDRYVIREFVRLFVLFVLAVPVTLTIFDVTENLGKYMEKGLPPGQIALSYVFQLPEFVLYAIPVAALIATVFTVNSMTRHSEVAAAKAAGVSFYRLMAPLPFLGLLLTGGALALADVVPVANRIRAEVLGERERIRSSRTDFVYRTKEGHVFAIRRLDLESGRIVGIAMEREGSRRPSRETDGGNDRPASGAVVYPTLHAAAGEATYEPGRGWFLEQGYLRVFEGGEERAIHFDRMHPTGFTETPDELLAEPKAPEEMRYAELGHFIEILERSGGRPLNLIVERWQKVSIPVATFIIILFAAPLAVTSHRGGPAYGVGISLAITILYLMLFKIFGAAGSTGAIPPVLAAWLPNLIFAVAAVFLSLRVRT